MRTDDISHPEFTEISLRETAASRVAYVTGTRFAVYWIVAMVPGNMSIESFGREYGIATGSVRSALAYARAFPKQFEKDKTRADENRKWVENADRSSSSR